MSGIVINRTRDNINKILVLILAPLGDTLFTTPAIGALRESFPGAQITALVWDSNQGILRGNPDIDHFVVCPESWKLPQILSSLHEEQFDLAVGLSNLGSFILPFCPAREKIGFKSRSLGIFYDEEVPDDRNIHAVDYCLRIVEAVGAHTNNTIPRMYYQQKDRKRVEAFIQQQGLSPAECVAIHPGGKFFTRKRWPVSSYKQLLEALWVEWRIPAVIIGGADDRELGEEIIDLPIPAVNAAGQLSIKETAAFLAGVRLFIGNDSAPLHIAASLGTPVIGLFGPTDPVNFAPRGANVRIIRKKLACNPCFRWLGMPWQYFPSLHRDCTGNCMELISIEDVMQKAGEVLKGSDVIEARVFFG